MFLANIIAAIPSVIITLKKAPAKKTTAKKTTKKEKTLKNRR